MTTPTIAQGLAALVIGLLLDWKSLIPWIGDRLAAVLAVVAGAALIMNTHLDQMLHSGATWVSTQLATHLVPVDPSLAMAVSTGLVGIATMAFFLVWLLAMIPQAKVAKKIIGDQAVSTELDSRIIWAGSLLPAFVSLVPGVGMIHTVATWVIEMTINGGVWAVAHVVQV